MKYEVKHVLNNLELFQGANRLCFQPYDHDEVAHIIRDRLLGSTAVEAEAIELASRKVS